MLRDAQQQLPSNVKVGLAPSGSSIKLNARNSVNGYHEGTTLKQKVFSLPKEVNGITQITSMSRVGDGGLMNEHVIPEHPPNTLSPLMPVGNG